MLPHHINAQLAPGYGFIAAGTFMDSVETILKTVASSAGAENSLTDEDWQRLRDGPLSLIGNAPKRHMLLFYDAMCELIEDRKINLKSLEANRNFTRRWERNRPMRELRRYWAAERRKQRREDMKANAAPSLAAVA